MWQPDEEFFEWLDNDPTWGKLKECSPLWEIAYIWTAKNGETNSDKPSLSYDELRVYVEGWNKRVRRSRQTTSLVDASAHIKHWISYRFIVPASFGKSGFVFLNRDVQAKLLAHYFAYDVMNDIFKSNRKKRKGLSGARLTEDDKDEKAMPVDRLTELVDQSVDGGIWRMALCETLGLLERRGGERDVLLQLLVPIQDPRGMNPEEGARQAERLAKLRQAMQRNCSHYSQDCEEVVRKLLVREELLAETTQGRIFSSDAASVAVSIVMDGGQLEQLCLALELAFPNKDVLGRMVKFKLSMNLEAVVNTSANLQTVVLDLVNRASKEGWVGKLVRGARQQNPGNDALRQAVETLGYDERYFWVVDRLNEFSPGQLESFCRNRGVDERVWKGTAGKAPEDMFKPLVDWYKARFAIENLAKAICDERPALYEDSEYKWLFTYDNDHEAAVP